eukprot:jgi/Botrbrau1/14409/Bobra.0014s0056.1
MWRDILSFVGSVSSLRRLWVASWPLAGCDSLLETFGFGSLNIGLVFFTPLL